MPRLRQHRLSAFANRALTHRRLPRWKHRPEFAPAWRRPPKHHPKSKIPRAFVRAWRRPMSKAKSRLPAGFIARATPRSAARFRSGFLAGRVRSIGSTQANCLFRPDANLNYRKKPPTPGSTAILEMVCIRAGVPTLTGFRYDVPTDKNASSVLFASNANRQ